MHSLGQNGIEDAMADRESNAGGAERVNTKTPLDYALPKYVPPKPPKELKGIISVFGLLSFLFVLTQIPLLLAAVYWKLYTARSPDEASNFSIGETLIVALPTIFGFILGAMSLRKWGVSLRNAFGTIGFGISTGFLFIPIVGMIGRHFKLF
jgi:hypothetical protein